MNSMFVEVDTSPEHDLRKAAFPRTGWAGFNYTALPREAVLTLMRECARSGIRVIGIGTLGLFAETARTAPIAGQRWVLCHPMTLDEREIGQLRDLGVVVTTHTNAYIWKSGSKLLNRIGRDRENDIAPLRRLTEAGVPFALATDNVPVSMWYPIWQSVARIDRVTNAAQGLSQALTREEALRAATAAWLTFEEDRKGTLEPGKLADVIVLSQDPLTCDVAALRDTVADLTIVGGKVVYERTGSRK
jgi:predicted amidohydrolase YtcJ